MSRTPSGPTSRVGAWAAFVVLVGLFAMHGLASHGSMSGTGDMGDMGSMAGVGATAKVPVTAAGHQVAGPGQAPDDGGHGSGAMPGTGSCVAVLVLLLLLVVLSLRRLGPTWLLGRARRVRLLTRGRARLPEPPDLWTLSVCRC